MGFHRVVMVACWILWAGMSGCAPQAGFLVTKPALLDINGWERLAILPFQGDPPETRIVQQQLDAALRHNGHYIVVEPAELELAAQQRPDADRLELARLLRVDVLLTGTVTECTATDHGRVAFEYQVVDVGSGQIRESRNVAHSYEHKNQHKAIPAPDEILFELAQRGAHDVVAAIAPHQRSTAVSLGRQYYGSGLADVRRGNRLAVAGNWQEAESAWEAALARGWSNHVALYNLALAAESRGDYPTAIKKLDRAIDLFGDTLYQRHRKELMQHQAEQSAAVAQIQAKTSLSLARRESQEALPTQGFAAAPYPPP